MDSDKLGKIRKKCDDAQGGYSGATERDYARDVAALLKEIDYAAGLLQASIGREQQQVEIADLWKLDCETAQLRARELEQKQLSNQSQAGIAHAGGG